MLIKPPADIKPSEITPQSVYLSRRKFITTTLHTGIAGAAINSGVFIPSAAYAGTKLENIAKSSYAGTDEKMTDYDAITSYNNFYEFGTGKDDPARYSGAFNTRPWSISIEGECDKPGTYDLEDFLKPHQLQERVYRMRCVEAWSMVIPWVGIPLADVLNRAGPTSKAKYVAFTTVYRPAEMPGQKYPVLKWPYVEGLRIDEAMHPLTILATGLYGEALPNQNGAPLRLVVPWKYGYKSIKSIVQIKFVSRQPPTSWNRSAAGEYGFYSNVNPEVDHPRWSQKRERRIGDFLKRDTLMFNGYGEQVAALYAGMDLRKNY